MGALLRRSSLTRAEKWKLWEKSQEEAEREEVKLRRQEMATQQEARKKKLEELKRQQVEGASDLDQVKSENDKINKQASRA